MPVARERAGVPGPKSGVAGGDAGEVEAALATLQESLSRLREARQEITRRVIGQDEVVDQLLISLLCGGHALLEGVPGLGKTLLVRTVGRVCGLGFSRIQFTPDLMPADITGTLVLAYDEAGRAHFEFQPGPLFAQMVLADEINRATPKTQSALLEAMQEQTVTVGGEVHPLPRPFLVLATQNPVELEGTYPLPEAQVDRFFFKLRIPYPSEEVLDAILEETTGPEAGPPRQILTAGHILELQAVVRRVPVASHVRRAVVRTVLATQPDTAYSLPAIRRYVRYGASPRGAQALVLAAKARALLEGRYNVSFGDLRAVACPALRHRIHVNFQAEADGITPEALLDQVVTETLGGPRP